MVRDKDLLISNVEDENRGYDALETNNVSASVSPKKFPQYVAAISATLSALAAGIVLGWTSPISTEIENGSYHNITVNKSEMGWIGSLTTLGALITCVPTGFICDLIGRKATLLLLIVPHSIGWSLLIWAKSLTMLYFGRFITGMAVGATCVAAPLYTSEIAQKEIRGSLGSYFQLMVTIGVLYAYFFGTVLAPTHYTLLCSIMPVVFVVIFYFQPETPFYYLKISKFDDAKKSLTRLRGKECYIDSELALMDIALKESSQNVGILHALRKKNNKKSIFISLSLMFFQQFSGINAVIFYTSGIFKESGVHFDPKVATIIVGVFQVAATFISSLIVDKLGRRKLLMISAFVMGISSILLGLFFSIKNHKWINSDDVASLGFLPILALVIFVIVFSLGFGPIPWMISGEIFTAEIKSLASSVSGSFNWFIAFLITKFYLEISESIGQDITFYFFAVISICATVFVYFIVPETKGKTVEEIQVELSH